MENNIQTISLAQQALREADTPEKTKIIESAAIAMRAWAKEQNDYEMLIASAHIWIMARRKTTELIQPNIKHGGDFQGNGVVTLRDYGFTKMQWNRRVKELQISEEDINSYFDDCIAKSWEPTLFGLHIWKEKPDPQEERTDERYHFRVTAVFGGLLRLASDWTQERRDEWERDITALRNKWNEVLK